MIEKDLKRVLVVDDDPEIRESLSRVIAGAGYIALKASDGREALDVLRREPVNVAVADLKMPEIDGFELLKAAKLVRPNTEFVLISAYGTIERAVAALKAGACDFIVKPFRRDTICAAVKRALARQGETCPVSTADHRAASEFPDILGQSPAMLRMLDMVRRVAPTWATVLIAGETGTGKELIALAVHRLSPRRDHPMVAMSCAAIPEALLEAELFGHEKGAFTGATYQRKGRFEMAHRGTLFLDEVGQLSPAVQAKLLRVLQSSEFQRVGGSETIKVNVRVIAATNIDLEQAVRTGAFRQDLYYRLNVVKIHVPPLRERVEDVPLLLDHFIRLYSARDGKQIAGIDTDALDRLSAYSWPGNVRELEHAIERAIVLTGGSVLRCGDFPGWLMQAEAPPTTVTIPVGTAIAQAERKLIEETLRYTHGDKSAAAHLLGIARRTIYRKLQQDASQV